MRTSYKFRITYPACQRGKLFFPSTETLHIIVINHHEHDGTYELNDFSLVRDLNIIYVAYLNIPDMSISALPLRVTPSTGNSGFTRIAIDFYDNELVAVELV